MTKLDLEDLGPQVVLNFLHYLEVERHNVPATRNVRLAAIHAFFRYCAAEHPDRMELCQRILAGLSQIYDLPRLADGLRRPVK